MNRIIGNLVWFAVAGSLQYDGDYVRQVQPLQVRYSEMEAWFDELGLDHAFLPPRIREVDSFRKATAAMDFEYWVDESLNLKAHVYVDVADESTDEDRVIRPVTREVRDGRSRVSGPVKVAELIYYRGRREGRTRVPGTGAFTYRLRRGTKAPDADPLVHQIEDAQRAYGEMSTMLSSAAIRGVVRLYLLSMDGLQMHSSGGLYFIPVEFSEQVEQLSQLVRYIGGGATFGDVPVPGDLKHRSLVNEALEAAMQINANELLREIKVLEKRDGPVSSRAYAELRNRYTEIRDLAATYAVLLHLPQDGVAEKLEDVMEALPSVLDRVAATTPSR